jgi:hypothetical protein
VVTCSLHRDGWIVDTAVLMASGYSDEMDSPRHLLCTSEDAKVKSTLIACTHRPDFSLPHTRSRYWWTESRTVERQIRVKRSRGAGIISSRHRLLHINKCLSRAKVEE